MPSFPKTQYYRSPKMLASMKHFPCMVSGADDGTIVGAHINESWAGKGRGIKSSDIVAALSEKEHTDYDGGKWGDDGELMWLRAMYKTMVYGFDNGIFVVAK